VEWILQGCAAAAAHYDSAFARSRGFERRQRVTRLFNNRGLSCTKTILEKEPAQ
jgi:hypothetical protein